MYAVIQTGGKQYRVSEGDTLRVEKLPGAIGSKIVFDRVMMVGGEKVSIGRPTVVGAKVTGEILVQPPADRAAVPRGTKIPGLLKKIIVFKFRRRKNYRRKNGHRQPFTEVKITGIQA